jgi:holo-[acyl-carrier protein] synthase
MILGVGIDMIEVERVAEKIAREKGFRELVFSKNEIAFCEAKTNKYEHYAARFAAKEAFLKALGLGWTTGTAFNEIEIGHNENGKPMLLFTGETRTHPAIQKTGAISVSLSHLKAIATAIVIIETA